MQKAIRKYLDYSSAPHLTVLQFAQYWASLIGWKEKRHELLESILGEAERLLQENPGDKEALQAKGDALVVLNKPQDALFILTSLAQGEGAGAYAFIGLARAYVALGNRQQAQQALEKAEKLWREGSETARGTLAYNIAGVWATMGELEKATLWLSRSRELYGFDRLDLQLDPDLEPLRRAGLLRQFQAHP